MKFLSWFSTREVVQFATDLATEFSRRYPTVDVASMTPQSENRLRGARDLMMSRAQVFAERHRLNILTRAKLANTLKWRLRELGYPEQTVDPLVYEVARIVTLVRS